MFRHLGLIFTALTFAAGVQPAFGVILAVDVNDRSAPDAIGDTPPGFSSYVLTPAGTAVVSTASTQAVGAYSVTLTPFDDGLDENSVTDGIQNTVGAIDDRDRATPVNTGALTLADIYDDIVFAQTSVGPTGGMDLAVSGGALTPNTLYRIAVYAFDSGSTPEPQPRTANWLDGNNANALVLSTSFSGAALPTSDNDYRFTGVARTDGAGALMLRGRNTTPNGTNGATSIGVFLSGFEVDVIPEPSSQLLLAMAGVMAVAAGRNRRSSSDPAPRRT